uniref:Uncharacterized protein n=1 Tax=Anguilla anguilla TaxID=7936 RepID=A0A0E9W7L5_ANGAN
MEESRPNIIIALNI